MKDSIFDDCLGEFTLIPVFIENKKEFLSIKDIHKRFSENMDTYVYTTNGIEKVIESYSGKFQDVVRVDLTNGESIYCTFSHRLILYSGEPINISHLRINDELLEIDESETIEVLSVVPIGMRRVYSIKVEDSGNFALKSGVYSSI